ncbi:MAG: hypothetical protein QF561_02750 [Phycisphaerales bacterium]|nr:hypothetical protein [Phycisphaerales bacterium]
MNRLPAWGASVRMKKAFAASSSAAYDREIRIESIWKHLLRIQEY